VERALKRPWNKIWERLGVAAFKLSDAALTGSPSAFAEGVYQLSQAKDLALSPLNANNGLDWAFPYAGFYSGESAHLFAIEEDGKRDVLPQVPIYLPGPGFDSRKVALNLKEPTFVAGPRVPEVLEFYKKWAQERRGRMLFDGENARLVSVSEQALSFQGCWYFDYISTNLALDFPLPAGTLREQLHSQGQLEPLEQSTLANSCGVNGLVFSSDGQMILQRRLENVLVRPSELCSGFSGTIDKDDIVKAQLKGGSLESLDAPREMVEELGVPARSILNQRFLGITRELIRGGAPEFFYAVTVDMPAQEILAAHRRDREGERIAIHFGAYGKAVIDIEFPSTAPLPLFTALDVVASEIKTADISIPLLTNVLLWHRINSPLAEAKNGV
jgi:hypothetical protein